jgi:cyanophycinase
MHLALLGSGEFEPWSEVVDRWLLERASGDGTVLILPAASAPEGDAVFDRWASMGLDHFGELGVPARVVPIKTREDAEAPEHAASLETASVAYFSGGNPAFLAETLAGTMFWQRLLEAMDRGVGYAGCSAGIACLGEEALNGAARTFTRRELWKPGLRLFPKVYLAPHWDRLEAYVPGLQRIVIDSIPEDCRLLVVDERTAILGDGTSWEVVGAGGAALMDHGEWVNASAGQAFSAPLLSVPITD